jgi:hypothetical protein
MNTPAPLPSWNEGATKTAIVAFVERTVADAVPVEERVATFDADGTLWCEHPVPAQVDFILRRLAEMAKSDPTLRDRQPWKAAYEHDDAWLGSAITEHYAGDDTKARALLGGVAAAYAGADVETFEAEAGKFLRSTNHPTLGRPYTRTAYQPMIDLLAYLQANGFTSYMTSGSGVDFMRSIGREVFDLPPERIIGSTATLEFSSGNTGSTVTHKAALAFLDDGPEKPIQIWSRTGRRPLVAGGNSNGDVPMLEFAERAGRSSLRLLINHDDAERESAYTSGAEKALAEAKARGWTVVSMKADWSTVWGS